ncbi:MAG TPA: 3-oxo-5-alpha-steroid 4-dehydrogenase, partial [Myxococcota bacterium]|nr:3-oxo-5-alpha-steroid 4-dehydrogenase [Myxococcota bacterium]
PQRWGWLIMESPAVVVFAAVYATGPFRASPGSIALLALWMSHYVHRAFVWPFRMRSPDRPMPASIAAMAFGFNVVNALVQAGQIAHVNGFGRMWMYDPHFIAGVALFVAGEAINHHADAVLLALRRPGETGYRVPYGGLYRWVSCPNYLGELLAWTGWAVATWTFAGAAFALFTAANLVPRARAHHRWYRETFPDYPPERAAILPGLW